MERLAEGVGRSLRIEEQVRGTIEAACAAHPDLARFERIGESEEGRPIDGVVLGRGSRTVSLVAGAHAEEPVGAETLRTLVLEGLRRRAELATLLDDWRVVVVPQLNPDGEARNRTWTERWPDPVAYVRDSVREPPGRDLEFGFPAMRPENRAVSAFLRAHAPFALHMSLHGMGTGEGAMLLIERTWVDRTSRLREQWAAAACDAGLGLHDHDRKGEKGFHYLGPGFATTPEGSAMRRHFETLGDDETASNLHSSSMEFVRGLGGDPLCLVTEIPLFLLPSDRSEPGVPRAYLALRERLPELRLRALQGESLEEELGPIRPVDLRTAVRLHLRALELGLQAVARA